MENLARYIIRTSFSQENLLRATRLSIVGLVYALFQVGIFKYILLVIGPGQEVSTVSLLMII